MNALGTHWFRPLHHVVRRFVDHFDAVGVFERHFGIPLILFLGIGQPVSNGQTTQIQMEQSLLEIFVASPNAMGDGRGVVSSVTFADDEEGTVFVLAPRLAFEKGLKEVIGIFGYHFFVAIILLPVGISDVGGLIQPDDVGGFSPGVGVDGGGESVGVDGAGSVFGEEGEGGGAAGSAGEPYDERGGFLLLFVEVGFGDEAGGALFEHPVEEIFVVLCVVLASLDVDIASQTQRTVGIAKVLVHFIR
mmetsp:Transcript_16587/g.34857  ORF Transcript_16587/g.34857 Transcript_16587/m.34857 type:complete len:247 (+) Transcript_16587:733-1473(+)